MPATDAFFRFFVKPWGRYLFYASGAKLGIKKIKIQKTMSWHSIYFANASAFYPLTF
jgi:hypothetical protein